MDDPASYFPAFLVDDAHPSISLITVLLKLGAVLFFVAANGFFVGAELALVSVRRPRLEARAAASSSARAALRLLDDPNLAQRMRTAGIEAARRYAWSEVRTELFAAYAQAVERSSMAAGRTGTAIVR